MIRALVFDCFGVFYNDPVFDYMRDPQTPKGKAVALHALDEQAASGDLSKDGFVQQAATLLERSSKEIEEQFFQGMNRNQQLIDFSQAIRPKYKVGLLSNIGGDMMDGFFTLSEQRQLFDAAILSGDVKMAKPDPEIFKLICRRLGVSLDEAVMVDDMKNNIRVAKELGMQGIFYRDFEQFESEFNKLEH